MLYFIALYTALADPVFEVRESASDNLLRLVDRHPAVYGPKLAVLAREATEPEIVARVRIPLACYYRWRFASYVPRTVPVWPIVDAFPVPMLCGDARYKGLTHCWMCWLPSHTALDAGPYWHRYRKGTERMVRAMILDGAEPGDCDDLLSRMWKLEQAAKSDCGDKFAESEHWTTWQGGYPRPRGEP